MPMERPVKRLSIRWILRSLRQGNIMTPKEAFELFEENHYIHSGISMDDREKLLRLLDKVVKNKKITVNKALKEAHLLFKLA